MSIPTGNNLARDAWARLANDPAPTGFRSELQHLLPELDRINAENVVFVCTDVHYAQNLAYDVDANGDGDTLRLHELVRGPVNAVRNPAKTLDQLDRTFNPTSLYAEGGLFNFGYVGVGVQPMARST